MPSGDIVMPQPTAARKRVVDLWLVPCSLVLGYDGDCELELSGGDLSEMPSPPCTAGSTNSFGVSRFSDDSSEGLSVTSTLRSTFEDWEDFHSDATAEVTVDCDGSQLIHIPYESPFYYSPIAPHSFEFTLPEYDHSSSPSSQSSLSSSSSLQDPRQNHHDATIIGKPNTENEATTFAKSSTSPRLLVDTSFNLAKFTGVTFPALSASWYFSGSSNSEPGASFPWESDGNGEGILDVPCSAISPVCPMDIWEEDSDLPSLGSRVDGCS